MTEKITTVRMTEKTKRQLRKLGKFGETYEGIIKKLMERCKEKKQ